MTVMSERYRPGVTVILTPGSRRIGALLRARDLDVTTLLAAIDELRRDAQKRPPQAAQDGRF